MAVYGLLFTCMNWGYSLLGVWENVVKGWNGLVTWLSLAFYGLLNGLISLLYRLWSLIGWFVEQIENVFKKLAGVSTAPGQDMASNIIQSNNVQSVFWNLTGLCTALLIFFTIVKIIQQHYKEKDGGNPYIIVFRMFKGMLMFFFVTAAVLVGLFASGVVLRALDAATGSGYTSITGKIFKAMAQDANRKAMGAPNEDDAFSRAKSVYYNRLTYDDRYKEINDQAADGGENSSTERLYYTVAEIIKSPSRSSLEAAYASLPQNKWAIVHDDGSLTPLQSMEWLEDYSATGGWNNFEDGWSDGTMYDPDSWDNGTADFDTSWTENGYFTGATGNASYQNDMFQFINLAVQPSISFSYSPITIWQENWEMNETTYVDTTILAMGSGPFSGYQKYKFKKKSRVEQPVGENNLFSINLNGGVSLQGSTAGAYFDLETFVSEKPYEKILLTLLTNMLLTKLADEILYAIPELPLAFYFSFGSIDLRGIANLFIQPIMNELLDGLTNKLLGKGTDSFIKWGGGADIPITSIRYEFDTNFEKLWTSLTSTFTDFLDQLNTSVKHDGKKGYEGISKVDSELEGWTRQLNKWGKYRNLVDTYNEEMFYYIQKYAALNYMLGQTPVITKWPNMMLSYNDKAEVESAFIENFTEMVKLYENFREQEKKLRPTTYKAKTYVGHIYRPVFTTSYTSGKIPTDATTIRTKNNQDIQFNFKYMDDGSFYRIMDWSAYSDQVYQKLSNYADIFNNEADMEKRRYFFAGGNGESGSFRDSFNSLFEDCNCPYKNDPLESGKLLFGKVFEEAELPEIKNTQTQALSLSAADTDAAADTDPTDTTTVRMSNAMNAQRQAQLDDFLSDLNAHIDRLKGTDSDDDSSVGFSSSEVLTLRDMSLGEQAADGSRDVQLLKSWIRREPGIVFGTENIKILPLVGSDITPTQIDELMITNDGVRRYLLMADDGSIRKSGKLTGGSIANLSNPDYQKAYVGLMSYTNMTTVNALYEYMSMNYLIGYMGLIIALGVYLNFTFGLIQRVVNLAVLYMMSPITIAFYPFDDGQKFQSNFVMPFYKNAIGAYAVIISLNFFMVLITPVQNAVTVAVGAGTAVGTLMGILALIAFCSMLPKIRDTINSILGAEGIQEKKLSQVVADAGAALSSPLKELKLDKAAKFAGNVGDRFFRSSSHMRELRDKLTGKVKSIKPVKNFLDRRAEKRKSMQDNIDAYNRGEKRTLTKAEQRLAKLQQKKADQQLKKNAEALGLNQTYDDLFNVAKGGDKDAKARLKQLRERAKRNGLTLREQFAADQEQIKRGALRKYLSDDQMREATNKNVFARAANGVISAKNKVRGGIRTGVEAVQGALKYTPIGDVAEALFHPMTGMMMQGNFGKLVKFFQPNERFKRLQQMNAAEEAWRRDKNDAREVFEKQSTAACEAMLQRDQQLKDDIKMVAAQNQAADAAKNLSPEEFADRYIKAKIEAEKRKGNNDEVKARQAARLDLKNMNRSQLQAAFESMGGVAAYANDLRNGIGGAQIKEEYLTAAQNQIKDQLGKNLETLVAQRKDISGDMSASVAELMEKFQSRMNLTGDDRISPEFYKEITKAVVEGEGEDRIAARLAAQIKDGENREGEIRAALQGLNFQGEVEKVKLSQGTENAVLNAAINYIKKTDKAREWAYQDLNINIDSQGFKEMFEAYRNMYDKDKQGGMLQQEELLRQKYKGDINNPAYQRELNALQERFTRAYERAANGIRNDQTARKFDYSVRQIEKEQAELVNMIGKQYRNRIDYHLKVNMSAKAKQIMSMDTFVRELKRKGDNIGAAEVMDRAIQAAFRQDAAAMKATGLDADTQQQFMQWGAAGESGRKELNSIRDYFDITRKFLGNAEGISGGKHIQAVRNQMAAMFRVLENQKVAEIYQGQLRELAAEESGLRRKLNTSIPTLVDVLGNNPVWEEAAKVLNLTDSMGRKVTNLGNYLKDISNRALAGELSEADAEVTNFTTKISKMMGDWANLDGGKFNKALPVNAANSTMQSMISSLRESLRAATASAMQDTLHGMNEDVMRDAYQINNKIQSQGGDNKAKG